MDVAKERFAVREKRSGTLHYSANVKQGHAQLLSDRHTLALPEENSGKRQN